MTSDRASNLPSLPFRVVSIAGRSATHFKFAPDAAARKALCAAVAKAAGA